MKPYFFEKKVDKSSEFNVSSLYGLQSSFIFNFFFRYFVNFLIELPFNFPKISYENPNIWTSVSRDIISPFAPKFPFFDVNDYMAEPVKKYLSSISLKKRDSVKKLTFESSVSNFDNILEEKDLPAETKLEQSVTFLEFYQKEKQFLDLFERKTEKPLRKNHKISKSFDLSVLTNLSSNYDKQIKYSRTSIMERSGTRLSLIPSSSPTEMRKSVKMNEKKSPLMFLKNGKHRVLQIVDQEFSEFLDSIFIREDHKKLVSKNCLALRIRRKSDVSFGGFCKKLSKISSLLSPRERKIAVLNQLIMKGKAEYAFDRSKDKKMTQSNSFHKKVKKVIKNSRLQEINRELAAMREVNPNQDVSDWNSNMELALKKSCSIDIMTQSKQMEFQE